MTLQEKYKKEAVPKMKEIFGYKNNLAAPRIKKVVVNCGIGRIVAAGGGEAILENIRTDLAAICGQTPQAVNAKKSISAFKARQGMKSGLRATLRGRRMYDFLSRLVNIALPRTKDFRGIDKKSIDQSGNLTIGVKEHIIFPEVSAEEVKNIFGFELTICTDSSREEAAELLRLLGFPIKD